MLAAIALAIVTVALIYFDVGGSKGVDSCPIGVTNC